VVVLSRIETPCKRIKDMKLKEETIADGPQYRRVPSTRDAVNNGLKKKLIDKGVAEATIEITTQDLPVIGCCPKVLVTATGTTTKKKKVDE